MAPPALRLVAVACIALALAALLLTFLVPWGTYLAKPESGGFTRFGCTGPFKDGEYRLEGFTTAILDQNGTIVQGCQRVIAYWSAPGLDNAAAIGQLRAGLPLVAVATVVAGVSAALAGWALAGGRLAALAAGMTALLAVATLGAGAAFFAAGVSEQVAAAQKDVQHELHADPDAFGWALGFWAAVGAGVLLLASAVLNLVAARGPPPGRAPVRGGEAASAMTGAPEPLEPEEPAEEVVVLPPGVDEAGRPPRRLTCPRCKHRFLGEWGVQPVCPECGFTRGS